MQKSRDLKCNRMLFWLNPSGVFRSHHGSTIMTFLYFILKYSKNSFQSSHDVAGVAWKFHRFFDR